MRIPLCNNAITSESHLHNNIIVLRFFLMNTILTSNDKLGHFRIIHGHFIVL